MASKALDLVSIGHALAVFDDVAEWDGLSFEQQEFLRWLKTRRDELYDVVGLDGLASTDSDELNAFLTSRGFGDRFGRFDGVGVVSVLDMLIEWAVPGRVTTVGEEEFPAFRLEAECVDVYETVSCPHPTVRVRTASGDNLWLHKSAQPASGLEMNQLAQGIMDERRTVSVPWKAGVVVPTLRMDVEADLAWILGLYTRDPAGRRRFVKQAFQQFRLQADNEGAHAQIATGAEIVAVGACGPTPKPYLFDEPFLGWFTQPDSTLPLAVFWADTDSWHN